MNQCEMDVRVFSGSKACNDRTMRSWSSGMIRFSLPERRERKASIETRARVSTMNWVNL